MGAHLCFHPKDPRPSKLEFVKFVTCDCANIDAIANSKVTFALDHRRGLGRHESPDSDRVAYEPFRKTRARTGPGPGRV